MSEPAFSKHPDEITLDVYIDQELTDAEAERIEAHLGECRGCRQYVETRRSFFALIAESEELSLASDMVPRVLETLQRGRWKLLAGVLSLEAVLAVVLLVIFGSRITSSFSSFFLQESLKNSLLWLGERVMWIGSQVKAGLIDIRNAVDLVPMPGFAGVPTFQFTWLHWTGILTGIFFLWLMVNRLLIDGGGMQRSRVS